jgi:hypothetical protein
MPNWLRLRSGGVSLKRVSTIAKFQGDKTRVNPVPQIKGNPYPETGLARLDRAVWRGFCRPWEARISGALSKTAVVKVRGIAAPPATALKRKLIYFGSLRA